MANTNFTIIFHLNSFMHTQHTVENPNSLSHNFRSLTSSK